MIFLTDEQKKVAMQMIENGNKAELFNYLTGPLNICKHSTPAAKKIFKDGFVKGFFIANELVEYLVLHMRERKENEK